MVSEREREEPSRGEGKNVKEKERRRNEEEWSARSAYVRTYSHVDLCTYRRVHTLTNIVEEKEAVAR